MAKVRVIRAELWGNYKDGFDNNGNYEIGKFEVDELTPDSKTVLKIAKEWFVGRSFPLNENSSNYIGQKSKSLTVEWQGELTSNVGQDKDGTLSWETIGVIYDVYYRGTYIGEIEITFDTLEDKVNDKMKALSSALDDLTLSK